jgi:hypothetical protein
MSVALPPAARAEFDAKDAQILGRTLGYSGDGMSGVVVVGVVFAPGDPESRREAELVRSVIGDGLPTGRVRLQARLVPVEQLAMATGLNALYLTPGLDGSSELILSAARRLQIPTISASLPCVESGRCVVGYTSEPTVQILINQGAAVRIGVHFLQAFRMLVCTARFRFRRDRRSSSAFVTTHHSPLTRPVRALIGSWW